MPITRSGIRLFIALAVIAVACLFRPAPSSAETDTLPLNNLPPNTRYAIWGDSITELTLYPRYVETYLLACAGRTDITVCTFGHSGETLGGMLTRQSDLDAFKPTLVSFNYGMNDTQYTPYTQTKGDNFDKTMRDVLDMLKARGIKQRVVAGPDAVDDNFMLQNPQDFFRGADPAGLTAAQSQNITLRHFRDIGQAAALDTDSAFADVFNRITDSYTAATKTLSWYALGEGGSVHPSPNGHFLIACELLTALSCNGDLGAFEVDMKGQARASAGHTVVSFADGVLILDSTRYPFCYNYDPAMRDRPDSIASILPHTPFTDELNRFLLVVSNLDSPGAQVTWGDQTKTFTRQQLAQGVNLTEHFAHPPFETSFAHVLEAVAQKQQFENYMIKLTGNFNANDNGGNIDENMLAVHRQLDADVKAAIVPVRHRIIITPVGAPKDAAPVIAGTQMLFTHAGQFFAYKMSVLNPPAPTPTAFAARGLPDGVQFNPYTGDMFGAPTKPGIYDVTLSAAGANGSATAKLTFTIGPPIPELPAFTCDKSPTAVAGQPFAYQITATNNPTAYFVTRPSDHGAVPPASSLPPGLTYDSRTGLVCGTLPTPGVYTLQLAAMNQRGVAITPITLTVREK